MSEEEDINTEKWKKQKELGRAVGNRLQCVSDLKTNISQAHVVSNIKRGLGS